MIPTNLFSDLLSQVGRESLQKHNYVCGGPGEGSKANESLGIHNGLSLTVILIGESFQDYS